MNYNVQGPIATAVNAIGILLANVPYFQAWTGTANPTTAANRIFFGDVGYPITEISIAAGVLTVTTREIHTMTAAQQITLEGASLGAQSSDDLDGIYTITAITANSFTATTSAPDTPAFNPDGAFVLPTIRPFAVVSAPKNSLRAVSNATNGAGFFNGSVEIFFENDVPSQYAQDPAGARIQADGEFGQLVQGILFTSGTADLAVINDIEPVAEPDFIATQQQADNSVRFERWRGMVRVRWGLES